MRKQFAPTGAISQKNVFLNVHFYGLHRLCAIQNHRTINVVSSRPRVDVKIIKKNSFNYKKYAYITWTIKREIHNSIKKGKQRFLFFLQVNCNRGEGALTLLPPRF